MSEKEDNVYKAKLAEQAERYDGMMHRIVLLSSVNFERHVAWLVGHILILVIRNLELEFD